LLGLQRLHHNRPQWSAIPPRSRGHSRLAWGGVAEFAIGGDVDVSGVRITAAGYVRSLHDGEFQQEFVGHGGRISRIGRSAVVRFGKLDVLICQTIVSPGDPQLYRAFGIEPLMYDLVIVKANTSFRVGYAKIAGNERYHVWLSSFPVAVPPHLDGESQTR
jgi:microcystin degradation protein MlrC